MRKKIKLGLFISTILLSPLSAASNLESDEENLKKSESFLEESMEYTKNIDHFIQLRYNGQNEVNELRDAIKFGNDRLDFLNLSKDFESFQPLITLLENIRRMLDKLSGDLYTNIEFWKSLMNFREAALVANQLVNNVHKDELSRQFDENEHEYYSLKQDTTFILNVIELMQECRNRLGALEQMQKKEDAFFVIDDKQDAEFDFEKWTATTSDDDNDTILSEIVEMVVSVFPNIPLNNSAASEPFITNSLDLLRQYSKMETLNDKIKLLKDGVIVEQSNLEMCIQLSKKEAFDVVIVDDQGKKDTENKFATVTAEDIAELKHRIVVRQHDISEISTQLKDTVAEFISLRSQMTCLRLSEMTNKGTE